MEVVLEVLTGYRYGMPELAQPGEPFHPYGEGYGTTERHRVQAMAQQLSFERGRDRDVGQRVLSGALRSSTVSERTIWVWVQGWRREGLRGLVDGRRSRGKKGFDHVDPGLVRVVDEELAQFDGSVSHIALKELERRVRVRLKREGIGDLRLPQRLTQQYLASRCSAGMAPSRRTIAACGEDPDGVGAAADLAVESSRRVVRPGLLPHVFGGGGELHEGDERELCTPIWR